MSDDLFSENVYVKAFVYPVVPLGKARIRTQVSASHTKEDLDHAIEAFRKAGKRIGILK
jgi:glycine C-acetyltransferase